MAVSPYSLEVGKKYKLIKAEYPVTSELAEGEIFTVIAAGDPISSVPNGRPPPIPWEVIIAGYKDAHTLHFHELDKINEYKMAVSPHSLKVGKKYKLVKTVESPWWAEGKIFTVMGAGESVEETPSYREPGGPIPITWTVKNDGEKELRTLYLYEGDIVNEYNQEGGRRKSKKGHRSLRKRTRHSRR